MRNILQIIGLIALLGLGFVSGIAWKNSDTTDKQALSETQKVETTTQDATSAINTPTTPNTRRLTENETATINLFERAAPSVVYITTTDIQVNYFTLDETEIPRGSGSGFIWDKLGHIITNYHVIQGAAKAKVTLSDGNTWEATVVGAAPEKDLAVLKIDAPRQELTPIPVGISADLLVGQSVFAIGNPFGLDQTLTTGIISALGREIASVSGVPIRDVIQTDAAINPGNSGGPLLDSNGALIGVNTAIYSPSGAYAGIGFSIPVDVVKWAVPELIEHGRIMRPTLGIELATQRMTQQLGIAGILVINVIEGSAAAKAGLQPTARDRYGRIALGDIIVGIDDKKVSSRNDLILLLEEYRPGDQIELTIIRDEQKAIVPLILDTAR